MDKLQFTFRSGPSLLIDGQKVDLTTQAKALQILDKQGNAKTILGFQAADGTVYRLKERAQGDGVNLVIYGHPKALSQYHFKVSQGDLTKARYDGQSHKKLDYRPGDFAMFAPKPEVLHSTLAQLGLGPLHASGSPPAPAGAALRPQSGLVNGGNYCYTNAALKLLMSTKGQALLTHLEDLKQHPQRYFGLGHTTLPEAYDDLRAALHEMATLTFQGQDTRRAVDDFRRALENPELVALARSWEDMRKSLAAQRLALTEPARKAEEALAAARAEFAASASGAAKSPQRQARLGDLEQAHQAARAARDAGLQALNAQAQAQGYLSLNDQINRLDNLSRIGKFAQAQLALQALPIAERTLQEATDLGVLNTQQEANEFLMWIRDALFIPLTGDESVVEHSTKTVDGRPIPEQAEDKISTGAIALKCDPLKPAANLQELLDFQFQTQVSARDKVNETSQWRADLAGLKTVTLTIDAHFPLDTLTHLDLNPEVTVPMTDTASGQSRAVRMRVRDVVVFQGQDGAGHYWMASREGNTWTKHDDAAVLTGLDHPADFGSAQRPRTIVLEVVGPSA